jgi:hypothetical protein
VSDISYTHTRTLSLFLFIAPRGRTFEEFIAESKSDDYILPKNGERLPISAGFQYCIAVVPHVHVAVGIAYP